MKVIRNYLYNVGYQILAIIVPLITSAYTSRILRPEGVGINAFTGSIIQYFILLANIGIGYYGNREIAYVRDNNHKLSKTFWEIQIIKSITTISSIAFFTIFMLFYTRNKQYLWAQSINLVAVAFDISWLYQGLEDFKRTVLRNAFVKIISMIAIFCLIKSKNDLYLYILIMGLSTFLGNIALWPHLKKIIQKIDLIELKPWRHFIPTIKLFIPQIATQVYVQLNKTMLGIFIGETASGFYQYSDNLVKLILALVTATGTVMLPHVTNAFSKGDMNRVNKMLYKSFDFVSAITYPMMFGLAAISKTLAPLYYGKGYEPVSNAIFIESVVVLMIGWSNVLGLQYLLPLNRVKEFTASVTIGAITNIILNIPLIYFWGLTGAMCSTVISEICVTLYQLVKVRKYISLKELYKGNVKYLFSSAIMFIFVFYMNTNLRGSIASLIAEVLVGVLVYGCGIIVLRAPILKQLFEILNKK